MTDDNELVFAAARRPRRNRHELRALRLRAAESPQMADGRSRRRLRRRGIAGRRPHLARPRASSRRSRRTWSASSSPMRTKTISARSPSSGRARRARSTRRASRPGLPEARRLGEPGAPKIPDRRRRARRRVSRSARSTSNSSPSPIRFPKAARWRSARRPDSSCIAATGRSMRRRRSARRPTRRASGRSAMRACSRSSAIRPTCCARAKARRRPTSPRRSPSSSPGPRAAWS